jgi:6-phosphogluconolactonase
MRSEQTFTAQDAPALSLQVAEWLVTRLASSRGRRSIVLSGGNTPLALFRCLARPEQAGRIDWQHLHIFWSDERWVPYTDPQSNYGAAYEALLRHVPIPSHNIHPVPTEHSPEHAAKDYARTLQAFYGSPTLDPAQPLFDVVLLGIGADGHTASLFPGPDAAAETDCWATAARPDGQFARVTLTVPVLNSAAALAFLVTGQEKRDIVARVREGEAGLPASRIDPIGDLAWFLDHAAAAGGVH